MKNRLYIVSIFLFSFILSSQYVQANNNVQSQWSKRALATPTVFKVKPNAMELCASFDFTTGICNGLNEYAFSPNRAEDNGRCDIAGASPGSIACSVGSTEGIPIGVTYNYMKVSISRTMWFSGTIPTTGLEWQDNSNYDGSLTNCSTSSSLTNIGGSGVANGVDAGVATTQAIYFLNAPGNDNFQGNGNSDSWATARGNSTEFCNIDWNAVNLGNLTSLANCEFVTISALNEAGYTSASKTGDGNYGYTMDYSTTWSTNGVETPSSVIWQGSLSSSDENLVMIYKLDSPYTRTSDIAPTLRMSFDVTDALKAQFLKYTANEDADGTEFCTLDVGKPGVTISIQD